MAHYALLNSDNIVVQVITGRDEGELGKDWEAFYTDETGLVAKRTSYNTIAGVHQEGKEPFRKNFAGIGYSYDPELDAFIAPKPFDSWLLNEDSCVWEAPVEYPSDGKAYQWNEDSQNWLEITGEN